MMFKALARLLLLALPGGEPSAALVGLVAKAMGFALIVTALSGLYWRGHSVGAAAEKSRCAVAQLKQDNDALQGQVVSLQMQRRKLDEALQAAAARDMAAQAALDRLKQETEDYVATLDQNTVCRLSADDVKRLQHIAPTPGTRK